MGSNGKEAKRPEPVSPDVAVAADGAYRGHAEHLRAFARRQMDIHGLSDSQLDAEGVVHDAFAEALPRWETIDKPAAYLFTVVRRRVGRAAPKVGRVTAADTAALDHASTHRGSTLAPRAAPEDAVAAREVVEAIGRLPDRQRAATYLRHVQGLSQAEIADQLGCAASTAAVQIHRGTSSVRGDVAGGAYYRYSHPIPLWLHAALVWAFLVLPVAALGALPIWIAVVIAVAPFVALAVRRMVLVSVAVAKRRAARRAGRRRRR